MQIIVLDKNKTKTLMKKTLTFISSAPSCDKNSTEPRATEILLPILPRETDYLGVKQRQRKELKEENKDREVFLFSI